MSGGLFGQIVIGPPGSGKTTYCAGMLEFLTGIGRKVCVVNLDPANEFLPYECAVNVSELISLEDVMDEFELGPNGGLIYCMEFLEKNLDWLKGKLDALRGSFLLFDCPGQAELYTHHQSMQNIFAQLQKWQYSVATVHLVDAHHCCDASKFISVLMLSLSTMINLGLPHVNILSKIDLVHQYGKLAFGLDYYTEVGDLDYLVDELDQDAFAKHHRRLNAALCELVQDYSLVSFTTLNITDKESMAAVTALIDRAIGYAFSQENMSSFGFAPALDQFSQHTQRDQELYCRWDSYADATTDAPSTADEFMKSTMNEDLADRRAYTRAAMDALREENVLRQSHQMSATIPEEEEEEIIGYIDEEGNVVRTPENAVGVLSKRDD